MKTHEIIDAAGSKRLRSSTLRPSSPRRFLARLALASVLLAPAAQAANMTLTKAIIDNLGSEIDFSQSTIGGLTNTLGPGDTVYISAHTRERIVLKNLTQGTNATNGRITITNTGGQFILNGTGSNAKGIELVGCQNVILKGTPVGGSAGIKIASTGSNGGERFNGVNIYEGNGQAPNDIEITGLEISNTAFAGIMAKCKNNPGLPIDGININNNYIHHTHGEAMYIGSTRDTHTGHSKLTNVQIHHNTLEAIGLDGIQVHFVTTNLRIYDNTIIGYAVTANTTAPNGEAADSHNKAIFVGESECWIERNWIETTSNWAGQGIFLQPYKNTHVYNNVVIHSHDSNPSATGVVGAITLYNNGNSGGIYAPVSGAYAKIINNTIVTPEGTGIINSSSATGYRINNIVAGPRNGVYTSGTFSGASTPNLHDDVSDVGFTDAANDDYTLSAGSPAVDTGADVSGHNVTTDFNGTSRPPGDYDMGAFERTGTPPDSSAPSVPTGLASSSVTSNSFTLSWTASTDNVGVTGYEVFRNGSSIGTPSGTTFNITGLSPNTNYSMTVRARDAAGNWSNQSTAVVVTTLPSSGNTFTFYPGDDAFLQGSTRYNDGNLKVQAGSRVSYLKFNVTGLSGTVTGVTLRLKSSDNGSGTLRIKKGNNTTWTETTLTTGNAPTSAGEVGSKTLGSWTSGTVYDFALTGLLTGNGTYSLLVDQDNASGYNDVWFVSKDGTSVNGDKPQLIVTTSGSDNVAPSIPTGLASSSVGSTSFTLSWTASTDNVGVTGYEVFRNGSSIGTPSGTTFNVTGLSPNTAYSMTVRARDAAANWSAQSTALSVTTSGSTPNGTGLRGRYYDNSDLTSLKLERTDAVVNANWGSGSPHSSIGNDTFSVRWEGEVQPEFSQTYTFYVNSNDGNRLWVNGQVITDRWSDGAIENSGTIALTAGQKYSIKLEFYEGVNNAACQLSWSCPGMAKQIIPQARLYPATTP